MIFYHPGKYERSLSARDSFDSLFFYRWTDGWMDGIFTDGRDGMGYQKGPLNFHFLSIYMMQMSTHIYIYSKIFTKILMGFIMPGVVIKNFKIKVDR